MDKKNRYIGKLSS